MIEIRKIILQKLFEVTQRQYTRFKKKKPWCISNDQLLAMPVNTFGYKLGCFLKANGFQLIPKVERHDAYHVLAGFPTKAEDEVALQFLCFGNGKRTPYLFAVLLIGTLLLPEYLPYFRKAFDLGRRGNCFHHFDFKTVLPLDYNEFRGMIFSEETIREMNLFQNKKSNQLINSPSYEK